MRRPIEVALLFLAANVHVHAVGETNYLKQYSTFSASLRTHLLSSYDSLSPPISTRSGVGPSGPSLAGAEIEVGIRFFKVNEVNLVSGSMSLKVWLRMSWTDERLSWDPLAWNNVRVARWNRGETVPALASWSSHTHSAFLLRCV